MHPQLSLRSQDAIEVEKFNKNGLSKDIHVVAKNLPWAIEIEAKGLDLTKSKIVASLLYDTETNDENEAERPVDFVHQQPLEYKIHINSSSNMTIEFRCKVLSSQLGSFFRVKLQASSNSKNQLECIFFSQPIKVISKPSQVSYKKRTPEERAASRKTSQEILTESLERLQQQHEENKKILEFLCSSQSVEFKTDSPVPDPEQDDFENAFRKLLESYNKLPMQERPQKLRRLAATVAPSDNELFLEFTSTASPALNSGHDLKHLESPMETVSSCGSSCPHKLELDKLNDLYTQIFSSPETGLEPF
jgi:hypothetical protein